MQTSSSETISGVRSRGKRLEAEELGRQLRSHAVVSKAELTAGVHRATEEVVECQVSSSSWLRRQMPSARTSAGAHQVLVDLPRVTVVAAAATLEREPDEVADAVAALDEHVQVLGQLEGRVEVLELDDRGRLGGLAPGRWTSADRRGGGDDLVSREHSCARQTLAAPLPRRRETSDVHEQMLLAYSAATAETGRQRLATSTSGATGPEEIQGGGRRRQGLRSGQASARARRRAEDEE